MSNKAYFFRLRAEEDVDDLERYIDRCDCAYFHYFWLPTKRIPLRGHGYADIEDTDLIAAITVDRGDLPGSFREEADIDRPIYYHYIDELPKDLETYWKVPEPATDEEKEAGWPTWAKVYLNKQTLKLARALLQRLDHDRMAREATER
jgi:hypothetical protein